MATATPMIQFCSTCEKRKGPVSSTHAGCGGDEATCKCANENVQPKPKELATYRSPHHSSDDQDEKEMPSSPSTAEKKATYSHRGKRPLSPAREAAVAIRRWSVKFFEIGLDFPTCMTKIAHLNPHQIFKVLKLDECASRTAAINWKLNGNAKMKTGAVKSCAMKALVNYKEKAPPCFNPFSAKEYAPNLEDTADMSTEQIWWLMNHDQRKALLMNEARALQDRKGACIRLKAEGDWYQSCMSTIRGGSDALRDHMRHGSKKRKVFEYFQQAQSNLEEPIIKKSKIEIDTITQDVMGTINVDDLEYESDDDSDF
jgi:hypothetical protein